MQTFWKSCTLFLIVCGVVTPVRAEIDAEKVNEAIDRGVAYLKREQDPTGSWIEHTGMPGGVTALCTLSLLNAGVSPEDPVIQKGLSYLRKIEPRQTYVVSLQTMVFCAANPVKDRLQIRKNVRWLQNNQIRDGARNGSWSYPQGPGDNSNSQFAVLALHEAERAGVEVSDQTWRRALNYWRSAQLSSGAFSYIKVTKTENQPTLPGTGSMTCAGIAALVITSGKLATRDASVNMAGQVQCCGQAEDDEDAQRIEQAIAWLASPKRFSVNRNPGASTKVPMWHYYYLYGLERVGRLSARRFLGQHDWYREGAERLLADQDRLSGSWRGVGHAESHPHVGTPLAMLFLSKGRRPVVAAKLKWDGGQENDSNRHRNDLAHLTSHVEKLWQRELTWQIIQASDAKVEDLLQAPVLLITGRNAPRFSAEQKKRLRDYIDRGGFLFAVQNCPGGTFDEGFRRLIDEMFVEPEYRLRLLPPEHPVWRAEQRINLNVKLPELWGVDYGCRTSIVYCPGDLSCYWELGEKSRTEQWSDSVQQQVDAALAIGANVLSYATNREPKYKDAISRVMEFDSTTDESQRGLIKIGKLQHPGGCNAAPAALSNLLRSANKELKLRISTKTHEIAINDPNLFRFHLVFMHGRHTFRFTPQERKQLRAYLERGGMLLVDSVCASREFTQAFRREMQQIFPNNPMKPIAHGDPLFTDAFGGSDIRKVTRRIPQQLGAEGPLRAKKTRIPPDLEAIALDGRYSVIFSPYDISCALEKQAQLECNGYTREDAARIGLNVLLYSLHR